MDLIWIVYAASLLFYVLIFNDGVLIYRRKLKNSLKHFKLRFNSTAVLGHSLKALVCLLFFTPLAAIGQQKITAAKVSSSSYKSLSTHFVKYSLFTVDAKALKTSVASADKVAVNIELVFPGLAGFNLLLQANDILSDDYQLTVANVSGKQVFVKPACITYAGALSNDNSSRVRLTITDDFIYGIIKSASSEYFIEPLKYFDTTATGNLFIIYETKDAITDPSFICGVTEREQAQQRLVQTEKATAGLNCVRTRMAIASDQSMFLRYGSSLAVQTHNIGVMNNVIWNYTNAQFSNNIEFVIAGQNVSTVVANNQLLPAYTGTNSSTMLSNFRAWGQAGNFGFIYDIGQMWTTRNIDSDGAGANAGIIGLTYIGAVCTASRYQLLEDFTGTNTTGSGFALEVLVTHETGHSFNCVHDATGTPFIMAPSVANVHTWSDASVAAVDAFVPSRACLLSCEIAETLTTDFIASPPGVCTGATTRFTDRTLGGPVTWRWSFEGGKPLTSAERNPVVSFATPGVKNVVLSTSNGNGYSVKGSVIIVGEPAAAFCFPQGTDTSNAGINSFTLERINKVSGGLAADGSKYLDFSCSDNTVLAAGATYAATANVGTNTPSLSYNAVQFFIDYNNDGDFKDANEFVYASAQCWVGNHIFSFTTPANPPVLNQLLRARLIARDCIGGIDACYSPIEGQVEDYGVIFLSPASSCDINYWTGSASKAWENPGNWSCGVVPDASTRVIIGKGKINYPEVKSVAVCKSLHNVSGTSVMVFTGFSLNVVGGN